MFQALEYDQQQLELEAEKRVRLSESSLLAVNLLEHLKQMNCVSFFVENHFFFDNLIDFRGNQMKKDVWNSLQKHLFKGQTKNVERDGVGIFGTLFSFLPLFSQLLVCPN